MVKELKTIFEEQAKQELFEIVKAFRAYKQEDGQSVSSYLLKMKSHLDTLERLGYPMPNELSVSLILNSHNKDYHQFVQNYNMHSMGKTIAELHAMLKLTGNGLPKKAETLDILAIKGDKIQKDKKKPQGCKTQICNTTQGLRRRRKLKHGALNLYVGNGIRATVEAIGSFNLILPNGLVIMLDHFHYAPFITKGVVSLSRLVDNGYKHNFMTYGISVMKDDMFILMQFHVMSDTPQYFTTMNGNPSSVNIKQHCRTRSLKSNKEPLAGEIARLGIVYEEIVNLDEIRKIPSFQDMYEHAGQQEMMQDLKISKLKVKRQRLKIKDHIA
ncbi:hypothetical protein Tco_0713191 [Tanacetum coccineum]